MISTIIFRSIPENHLQFSLFHSQVATSLPKTSYFKLVDVWLVFCIFSTFFIIVFHILIDFLHNRAHSIVRTDATLGKPCTKMLMKGSERFLSGAKVHGVQLEPLAHLKNLPDPRRPGSASFKDGGGKERDRTICGGDGVWDPVRRVEKFARAFMLVVFVIFNVIYWITAYAY